MCCFDLLVIACHFIFTAMSSSNLFCTASGNICSRDILNEMEVDDKIIDVDNNFMDPQLCATFACDIYKHLRASEVFII